VEYKRQPARKITSHPRLAIEQPEEAPIRVEISEQRTEGEVFLAQELTHVLRAHGVQQVTRRFAEARLASPEKVEVRARQELPLDLEDETGP
jgi:hypothetical protein